MIDLRTLLVQRGLARQFTEPPTAPTGLPVLPPMPGPRIPPALRRYQTGLRMQQAYANQWTPHPLLVRILSRF